MCEALFDVWFGVCGKLVRCVCGSLFVVRVWWLKGVRAILRGCEWFMYVWPVSCVSVVFVLLFCCVSPFCSLAYLV